MRFFHSYFEQIPPFAVILISAIDLIHQLNLIYIEDYSQDWPIPFSFIQS
jgi:hypothetical protein